jgi:hypothetical protein
MTEPLGPDSSGFYLTYPSAEEERETSAKMFARLSFLWKNRKVICERWEKDAAENFWDEDGTGQAPYFVDYIDQLFEEALRLNSVPLSLSMKIDKTVVKWDADMIGETLPVCEDPTKHPACLEVIEILDGEDPKILYRRD